MKMNLKMTLLKKGVEFMSQKDYMEYLKDCFQRHIVNKRDIMRAYNYSDKRAVNCISSFKKDVESVGLKFSNCYHANGIGNNNEYTIYLEGTDPDGFKIKREVAEFYYCYGIFGGVYVSLKNSATEEKIVVGKAS